MCVAIPGRVAWVGEAHPNTLPARVDFGSSSQDVDLVMVPDAGIGDYVIVHSGYAIRKIDQTEVAKTFEILDRTDG